MAEDPYAVLGVAHDAPIDEIKRAYRALARDTHPDRNPEPDAEARFKRVAAAWEVLSDAHRRAAWHAAHDPGVRGTPRRFLEDFTDALERAEALVLEVLLPRYLDGFRGAGAEVAARFARDLTAGPPEAGLDGPRASWRGRRRARAWARRVDVCIDYGGAWAPVTVQRKFATRGWRIVFHPQAFWVAGIREPGALDAAVAEHLAARVVGVLAADAGVLGDLLGEDGLARARARDASVRAARLRTLAFWLAVATLAAVLITSGLLADAR